MIYQTKNNGIKLCCFRHGKKYLYSRITLAFCKEKYIFGCEWNDSYIIVMVGVIALLKDSDIDNKWHIAIRSR